MSVKSHIKQLDKHRQRDTHKDTRTSHKGRNARSDSYTSRINSLHTINRDSRLQEVNVTVCIALIATETHYQSKRLRQRNHHHQMEEDMLGGTL